MDVVVSSTDVVGADVDIVAGSEGVEPPADTGADADATGEEESLGAFAGAGFSFIMLWSAMARSASSEDGSVNDGLSGSSSGSSPSSNSPSSRSSFCIVQAIACQGQIESDGRATRALEINNNNYKNKKKRQITDGQVAAGVRVRDPQAGPPQPPPHDPSSWYTTLHEFEIITVLL
jgi:hypothetical protein